MSDISLVQILEGALLAAGKPMTVAQLAELFEEHERPETTQIREALKEVAERCDDRGFELQEVSSGFRFQVRQALAPWVARLWHERPQKYSRALLETLALVAYRQPITRGEIEEIRGVAVSSNIIKTLHEREWIRVVGHRDVPGRPAMYATTKQFLDYFNLKSLDQLPALAEIRDVETLNAELGFSEPVPGAGEGGSTVNGDAEANGDKPEAPEGNGARGLTLVGGTEHTPGAAQPQASADEASADPEVTAGVSLADAADELEARAPGGELSGGEAPAAAPHEAPAAAPHEAPAASADEAPAALAGEASEASAHEASEASAHEAPAASAHEEPAASPEDAADDAESSDSAPGNRPESQA
jgi:segregation and condensation protein B